MMRRIAIIVLAFAAMTTGSALASWALHGAGAVGGAVAAWAGITNYTRQLTFVSTTGTTCASKATCPGPFTYSTPGALTCPAGSKIIYAALASNGAADPVMIGSSTSDSTWSITAIFNAGLANYVGVTNVGTLTVACAS